MTISPRLCSHGGWREKLPPICQTVCPNIPNGLSHSRGPIVVSSVRPDIFMYQKFLTRGTRYQLSPVF